MNSSRLQWKYMWTQVDGLSHDVHRGVKWTKLSGSKHLMIERHIRAVKLPNIEMVKSLHSCDLALQN